MTTVWATSRRGMFWSEVNRIKAVRTCRQDVATVGIDSSLVKGDVPALRGVGQLICDPPDWADGGLLPGDHAPDVSLRRRYGGSCS